MLTPLSTVATTTISAAAVIIWFSITVSAQAAASAPFSGMEPSSSEPEPYMPSAPGPATTPTNDCVAPLLNMSDCLTYVQETSNVSVPDKNCCPELAGFVDGNRFCVCELLRNISLVQSFGIRIEISRALKLPSLCRVATPSVSMCAGYTVPGPAPSQGSMSPSSLSKGVQPPGALASSPSAGDNGSGALAIAGPAHAFFVGLPFLFLLTFF